MWRRSTAGCGISGGYALLDELLGFVTDRWLTWSLVAEPEVVSLSEYTPLRVEEKRRSEVVKHLESRVFRVLKGEAP